MNDAAYACPALTHLAPDLVTDGFYRLDDPTHSIIDPERQEAYRKSSDGVKNVGMAIVKAADNFRSSGSRSAAQCAMAQIVTLAARALACREDVVESGLLRAGMGGRCDCDCVSEGAGDGPCHDRNRLTRSPNGWRMSASRLENYYDTHKSAGHGDSQNNHLYWAGVELAAIGVAANNRKDFDWAMATYDNGVDQIQSRRALPFEMARGSRALHYHLYALAPLVLLAEFGEANHLDLYAHANGAIHRLVNFSIAGLQDPARRSSKLRACNKRCRRWSPEIRLGGRLLTYSVFRILRSND